MNDHERQGSGHDADARGHERQGRAAGGGEPSPPGEQAGLAGLADELNPPQTPAGEGSPASEASGDDEAKAVSPVLDDPRSIEEEPDMVCIGTGFTIAQLEEMQHQGRRIELRANGEVWENRSKPRDRAAGRPQRGVPVLEPKEGEDEDEEEEVPAKPVDRAEGLLQRGNPDRPPCMDAPPPVDRAEGFAQKGTLGNPDPIAFHSGLPASVIAQIAFGAVQSYKGHGMVERGGKPWPGPDTRERTQIIDQVRRILSGDEWSPAALHAHWAENQIAAGVTAEEDPRVVTAWGDLDPGERRKGFIFAQVCVALIRQV
jgi:hypothetical protein